MKNSSINEMLNRKMEKEFERLADKIAEHIALAIWVSTLTEDDKQAIVNKYTTLFIEKFNQHMKELSELDSSKLEALLMMENKVLEAKLRGMK